MAAFFKFGSSILLVGLVSCSKEAPAKLELFQGACEIEINSDQAKGEILLDGIKVGKGAVKLNVPCGHRQVIVQKSHFVPFEKYIEVKEGTPAIVTAKLKEFHGDEDYALSRELIDRLKEGKSPVKAPEHSSEAAPESQDSKEDSSAPKDDWS